MKYYSPEMPEKLTADEQEKIQDKEREGLATSGFSSEAEAFLNAAGSGNHSLDVKINKEMSKK